MISFFKTVSALAALGSSTPVADTEKSVKRRRLAPRACLSLHFNVDTLAAILARRHVRALSAGHVCDAEVGAQHGTRLQCSPVLRLCGEIILSASSEKLSG